MDANIQIALNIYRNSISKPILQLFVLANWITVNSINEITEAHFKAWIAELPRVNPADYDLARTEHELREVKLERTTDNGLRSQVWSLCLNHMSTLEKSDSMSF